MRKTLAFLLAFSCLSGCADIKTAKVQTMIVGRDQTDIETCLGIPTRQAKLADNIVVEEWDYTNRAASASGTLPLSTLALLPFSVPLATITGSLSLSGSGGGNCTSVITMQDGRVKKLIYTGDSSGLTGQNALCVGIIRGCLNEWEKAALHRQLKQLATKPLPN